MVWLSIEKWANVRKGFEKNLLKKKDDMGHVRMYTLFFYRLPPSYKITISSSFPSLSLSLSLYPASVVLSRTLQEDDLEMFHPLVYQTQSI